MKKKISIFLISLLFLIPIALAIPNQINLQGRLLDSSDTPVTTAKTFNFTIFSAYTLGTPLYTQTNSISPSTHGYYDATLTNINLPFNQTYYLNIKIEGQTLTPRTNLTSHPYAFRANASDYLVAGGEIAGTVNVSGDLLPSSNITHSIGSSSWRWLEGWFETLYIGSTSYLSVEGTNPAWRFDTGNDLLTYDTPSDYLELIIGGASVFEIMRGTSYFYTNLDLGIWNISVNNLLVDGFIYSDDTLFLNDDVNISGQTTFGGDLIPDSTLSYDIGSGANRWRNIYATNISGDYIDITNDLTALGNITGVYYHGSGAFLGDLNLTGFFNGSSIDLTGNISADYGLFDSRVGIGGGGIPPTCTLDLGAGSICNVVSVESGVGVHQSLRLRGRGNVLSVADSNDDGTDNKHYWNFNSEVEANTAMILQEPGNLWVKGNITATDLNITERIYSDDIVFIDDALNVSGIITTDRIYTDLIGNSTTGLWINNIGTPGFYFANSGDLTMYGTLSVDGDADLCSTYNTLFVDCGAKKVGIGTDAPDEELTITGDINVSGYIKSNDVLYLKDDVNISGQLNVSGWADFGNITIGSKNVYTIMDAHDTDTINNTYTGCGISGVACDLDDDTIYWTQLDSIPQDTNFNTTREMHAAIAKEWDNITGIPHATPSDGDTTHFSLADEIFDWIATLNYVANAWDALTDMVLADGSIYIGDASNDPVARAITGDITLSNTGVIAVVNTDGLLHGNVTDWDAAVVASETDSAHDTCGEITNCVPNAYDTVGDIPTATPSDGDTTHLSTADHIYDWVIGLGYLTTETLWNANYSTFLTHITWAEAVNGTLAKMSDVLGFDYYNATDFDIADYWDATTDLDGVIDTDEITELKIDFNTACAAGNHLYVDGNNLACEADAVNDAVYNEATIQSVCTFCIGDAQIEQGSIDATELATNSVAADELLYDTGQHLTTTSSPTFVNLNSINCITFDSGGQICSGA